MNNTSNNRPQARFGTFGGVFTPCVLTILGVIMFMRTGYVSGYAGLWFALAILGLAKTITFLTTLSISAIATNMKMKGGGPYYMISRVLGPDFGGSIGITLYFAQAVGVAFYVIGFTEAFFVVTQPFLVEMDSNAAFYIENWHLSQIVSSVVTGGLFLLSFKGADVAIRAQYFILALLVLAIASFVVGGVLAFDPETFHANQGPAFTDNIGFWALFAILFPATTGITAGVNMSGDLKNPARSIPLGTLLAIGFTITVYVTQIVLMAGAIKEDALQKTPFESLQQMSIFGPLIVLGVFAATLSSALGSFLGAPRILQAMGQDHLMGILVFFRKGSGANNEPKRATVFTFVVAVAVIWAGDLNTVAEVLSMFFLIAYGMLNLAAFVESKSGNPSFRPTFRFFHWSVGLAGAIGCGVVMMKINDTYALIALVVTGVIYFYLKKRDISTTYGDAKRGYIFKQTRNNLLYLKESKPHPKNWRPMIVAISEDPTNEMQLIRMGAWLEAERGLYSVAWLAERPNEDMAARVRLRTEREEETRRLLDAEGIVAFPEALIADDISSGLFDFLQSYSLNGVRPNTVLCAMPPVGDILSRQRFLAKIDVIATFDKNLVVLNAGDIALKKKTRIIDIWWRGESNGSLMALFAYMITLDAAWSHTTIRIFKIVKNDTEEKEAKKHMNELINIIRMSAQTEIVRSTDTPTDIIAATSAAADLVILGMHATSAEEDKRSLEWLDPLLARLPSTLLVWSNGDADVFV
ncbi:MAG: amino acid permease [Deltaproteobacteria bacterium]|nr:amino acid permease [Deltaproteobacteria bacterium]